MRPVRVGAEDGAPPAPRGEDAGSSPLFALPRFPAVAGLFCAARLVRPILLAACFPDGPHAEDVGAELALALGWMAAALGVIGAMLLLAPLRGLLEESGGAVGEELTWQTRLLALCLLAFAVVLDGLHQVLAVARADFFWGTGILGDAEERDGEAWEPAVAGLLSALHALGLLGTLLMVCGYWRHYMASWRQLFEDDPGRLHPIFEDIADFEKEPVESKGIWTCPACDEPNNADRTLCNNCSGPRPPPTKVAAGSNGGTSTARAPPRGGGRYVAGCGPSGGAAAAEAEGATAQASGLRGAAASAARSDAPAPKPIDPEAKAKAAQGRPLRPFATAGVDFADEEPAPAGQGPSAGRGPPDAEAPRRRSVTPPGRKKSTTTTPAGARGPAGAPRGRDSDFMGRSPGSPPLAWLWAGGEWLRVRVLRTESGSATVRLPGGGVVSTSQKLLRPRSSDEDEPPPPSQQPGRPSSSAGCSQAPHGPRPARAGSAPPGATRAQPSNPEPSNPEERWASERMARLRTELCELDGLEQGERKSRLRTLQRELHPDKQPPDLRKHVEPLFHLVQRQWEVDESLLKAAAQSSC